MNTIRMLATVIVMFVIAAGTASPAVKAGASTETFQKSYPLRPDGTVSLENINGDVTIKTWDKNEVLVEAVKHADDGDALADLRIEVDASGDRVAVHTRYPSERGSRHDRGSAVDYSLTIPKGAKLDRVEIVNGEINISGPAGVASASTVNGTIHAEGLTQGCALESVNGRVEASFSELPGHAQAELRSVNGSLALHLPESPDADVRARTTMGRISNEFGMESSEHGGRDRCFRIGDSLLGKLGKGGASVTLETVNGSISILKTDRR